MGGGRDFDLQSSAWSLVHQAAQCEVAADGGQGQHLVQGDLFHMLIGRSCSVLISAG